MVESETPGRLAGRVALVTGAASGIGWQIARRFSEEGARVMLTDVDAVGVARRVVELEGRPRCPGALAHPFDVTEAAAWDRAMSALQDRWQGLDVLVNCAGITDDAPLVDFTLERWRRVLTVNLDGAFLGTRAAMRAMATRGRGAIVNVASVSAIKASPGAAAYCASKAGVVQLTKVAALECARAGHAVRVNAVLPGGVKTPMWETSSLWPTIAETDEWKAPDDAPPLNRFARPEEIAEVVLFLASDAASFVSGAALPVDGGFSA